MKNGELYRFIVSGGISTSIDFSLYILFSEFIQQDVAKSISILIAMIVSYHINRRWTFRFHGRVLKKFFLCQLGNIAVNVIVNHVVFLMLHDKIVAMITATGVAFICNYLWQKNYVFVGR